MFISLWEQRNSLQLLCLWITSFLFSTIIRIRTVFKVPASTSVLLRRMASTSISFCSSWELRLWSVRYSLQASIWHKRLDPCVEMQPRGGSALCPPTSPAGSPGSSRPRGPFVCRQMEMGRGGTEERARAREREMGGRGERGKARKKRGDGKGEEKGRQSVLINSRIENDTLLTMRPARAGSLTICTSAKQLDTSDRFAAKGRDSAGYYHFWLLTFQR